MGRVFPDPRRPLPDQLAGWLFGSLVRRGVDVMAGAQLYRRTANPNLASRSISGRSSTGKIIQGKDAHPPALFLRQNWQTALQLTVVKGGRTVAADYRMPTRL